MGLFKKYKYKPSFESKTKAKIVQLTEVYEYIFLKTINKEKLSSEENTLLINGIDDIREYIVQGIFFKMTENYNSKTPIEKKAETLFNQLIGIYSYTGDPFGTVKEELEEIASDTVYGALGYDKKISPFLKKDEKSYFIKYVQSILFYKTLNLLEEKTNSIKSAECHEHCNQENELLEILEESPLKNSIPQDIFEELKEALRTNSCPKHLSPYMEFLKNTK